jgi:hypothetical protein
MEAIENATTSRIAVRFKTSIEQSSQIVSQNNKR